MKKTILIFSVIAFLGLVGYYSVQAFAASDEVTEQSAVYDDTSKTVKADGPCCDKKAKKNCSNDCKKSCCDKGNASSGSACPPECQKSCCAGKNK